MNNSLLQNDLTEVREGFIIDNLEGATWAFRKLRALQEKEAELCLIAEQEKARIDNWLEKEKKAYESDKEYFEGLLIEYYLSEKQKDKKFKLSTPYGKVSSRKSKTWTYEDEQKLIEYLENSGEKDLIRVKKELNKSDLKKQYTDGVNSETGEALPFVRIEEKETFTVKAE